MKTETADTTPGEGPLTAGQIMHEGVIGCPPDEPLSAAAARMVSRGVHALVIGDEGESAPAGSFRVLSAMDLLRALGSDQDPDETTVGSLAATEPLTVDASRQVAAVARIMSEHEVSHVFVLEPGSGRPVGVVSSLDVARSMLGSKPEGPAALRVLVAHDAGPGGDDAVALARVLAAGEGSAIVALIVPYPPGEVGSPPLKVLSGARTWQELCNDLVAQGKGVLRDRAFPALSGLVLEEHVVLDDSPARALMRLCEAEQPDLLVLASTRRGRVGRLLAGTTGDRVLNGAPCNVAVAPRGYAEGTPRPPATIGVGFDGSEGSMRALKLGVELARKHGASLRVIAVAERAAVGELEIATEALDVLSGRGLLDHVSAKLRADAERRLAADYPEGGAEIEVARGEPAEILLDRCARVVDLLVVGSRGYGPLRRVLLGSVSGELTKQAECPVVVCPR